jgi:hypothetical protein
MSKPNIFQALSYSNISPRARFGVLLGGILFLSAIFLYQVHPPHLEDFSYTPHSPPSEHSPLPGHSPPSEHSAPPQNSAPSQHGDLVPGNPVSPPSYGFLESRLAYQETLYQVYLEERKGLITKWGPTPDKVKT